MKKKLSAFASRFFDENLKVLYRAGFVDGDNEMTDLGREHLEIIVLATSMDELVKAARGVLKENRKDKNSDDDEEEDKKED